jgi:hypothetical protein
MQQLTLVVLRPKMSLIADPNQLRADASFATFPTDASFQYVINTQFTPDLADGLVRVLINHRRGAGYDTQMLGT